LTCFVAAAGWQLVGYLFRPITYSKKA